jgi:hypothetical protein
VLLPGLDLVNTLDRMQIHRIDREAVKGVCRQGYYVTFSQTGDNVIDPVWLGFIGMDAQDFRGQEVYLCTRIAEATKTEAITAPAAVQVEQA